jgi:hypothetical protein
MHLWTVLTSLALASSVSASVLNLNIYTDSDASDVGVHHDQLVLAKTKADDDPAWRKRDEGHLVPLVPEARTGAIPIEVEEALIYTRKSLTSVCNSC